MNQNEKYSNGSATQPQNKQRRQTQLRKDADEMLRDIAFVLKMTQRVRAELNAEQEADELAFA